VNPLSWPLLGIAYSLSVFSMVTISVFADFSPFGSRRGSRAGFQICCSRPLDAIESNAADPRFGAVSRWQGAFIVIIQNPHDLSSLAPRRSWPSLPLRPFCAVHRSASFPKSCTNACLCAMVLIVHSAPRSTRYGPKTPSRSGTRSFAPLRPFFCATPLSLNLMWFITPRYIVPRALTWLSLPEPATQIIDCVTTVPRAMIYLSHSLSVCISLHSLSATRRVNRFG